MKAPLIALVGVTLAGAASPASAFLSRMVYMGSDPAYHAGSNPEAVTLVRNALTWAGGSAAPNIAYVEEDSYFAPGSIASILGAAGLSGSATAIPASSLATWNLSGFDVLLIGAAGWAGASGLSGAAGKVQGFVNAGGGLVVETEARDAASWSWLPNASLIGHSGKTMLVDDTASITLPSHPVMAGLTAGGLSGWGQSIHGNFATPLAGGFVELASDVSTGQAYIIATVPAPGAAAVLALSPLAGLRRRRKAMG